MHVVQSEENKITYNERFIIKSVTSISKEFGFNLIQERALMNVLYQCTKNVEIFLIHEEEGDFYTYIDLYLKSKQLEGLQSGTLQNKKYMLLELNSYLSKAIENITIADLKMYVLYKQSKCKSTSLNGIIVCIREFFKFLYEEGYLESNPARKLKKLKEEKRLKHALNEVTFEKIRVNCKNSRDRALIELLYSSGLRVAELVSLNKSDITPGINTIKVIGKGQKERIVFYSDISKFYLEKYLSERTDDNEALFVSNKRPFKRLTTRGVQKIFERIKKDLNITEDFSPHILRHTFATRLASSADITTVQRLLGHSNINTTMIYAEISDEKISYEYKASKL